MRIEHVDRTFLNLPPVRPDELPEVPGLAREIYRDKLARYPAQFESVPAA
jgi:hypothetical protein